VECEFTSYFPCEPTKEEWRAQNLLQSCNLASLQLRQIHFFLFICLGGLSGPSPLVRNREAIRRVRRFAPPPLLPGPPHLRGASARPSRVPLRSTLPSPGGQLTDVLFYLPLYTYCYLPDLLSREYARPSLRFIIY